MHVAYSILFSIRYLAVYYLDTFMDNHSVRFWRFYMVALVALRLAGKIEEKDFTAAKSEELTLSESFAT